MTEETRRTEPIDQPQTPEAASANESTANANEEKTDVMPSLEEMLRIAEQKAAEHHDAWLRAKAEAENVRRRAQEEVWQKADAQITAWGIEHDGQATAPMPTSIVWRRVVLRPGSGCRSHRAG